MIAYYYKSPGTLFPITQEQAEALIAAGFRTRAQAGTNCVDILVSKARIAEAHRLMDAA